MKATLKDKSLTALKDVKLSVFALAFALGIGAIVMWVSGYSPAETYKAIFVGTLTTQKGIVLALSQATPLMFSGLAFAIAYKVKMINTGAEGQLHIGAMASVLVGIYVTGLPMALHIPLALLVGALAGGLIGLFVTFLKVRFGASEIVTTIMLNEVLILFTSYLCNGPFLAKDAAIPQTELVEKTARLPKLVARSQLTIAIFIAIGIALLLYILFKKTALGYEMQVTGSNTKSASTAGISVNRVYYITFFISSAVAALCGSALALGVNGRFLEGFSNKYGFAGISVAALAAYNPLAVILSAILFGVLKAGAMTLNTSASVPVEFVDVIQALVVVFVAAPRLIDAILSRFGKAPLFKKKASTNNPTQSNQA